MSTQRKKEKRQVKHLRSKDKTLGTPLHGLEKVGACSGEWHGMKDIQFPGACFCRLAWMTMVFLVTAALFT